MKLLKILLTTTLLCGMNTLHAQKYVGGDISLLPTYEEHGANYMDPDGNPINNLLQYFKDQDLNAMRVRLFVDPSQASTEDKGEGVRQDLAYVKALGKRIKDAGMKFILDFHYSDTWADPSQQATPASFKTVNTPATEYIYTYTKDCLNALVEAGATPDFIQTGNEITYGMMWDSGCKVEANTQWNGYKDTNWSSLTTALKNAGRACREVCPNAKIIIHTERVPNIPQITDFYQRMDQNEVDYDIIGTSYYPYYHGNLTQLDAALTAFETTFPTKDIMVVETGCGYHYQVGDNATGYPLTYEGQRQFTAALVTTLNQHQNVKGLFWWFPEANEYGLDWNTQRVTDGWYNASLFDNETGKALPALFELKKFCDESAGMQLLQTETAQPDCWYTLSGCKVNKKPDTKGIYVANKRKIIVK
ncbi:glycosyl hydrolase 53 family protein [Prevotella sp. P6B1]|uniref:glycosyl hydrolase 53 family protein n=1 Tax=Prevotella sp. P6B1 TaxID=1410613 RepID=UPI00051B51BD|nr:glycosyl hydrolase 53 family protein [Prevotella sp. P6B1]